MSEGEQVDADLVRRAAGAEGLSLAPSACAALAQFGSLFLRWNTKINLGGRISARELVERHFADAFAAAQFINDGTAVVDVGSGGGLPAIPLALVRPGVRFELWEPTAKKVAFLRTAVRELDLGSRVVVHAGRIDSAALTEGGGLFDMAISRATFAPLVWLELGRGLIAPGGKVLVFATNEEPEGCPLPLITHSYGSNRRLLVFGAA